MDKGSFHPHKRLILLSDLIGWLARGTAAFVGITRSPTEEPPRRARRRRNQEESVLARFRSERRPGDQAGKAAGLARFARPSTAGLTCNGLILQWVGRGEVFTDLNRLDEALAAFDKALSIKHDIEGAWSGRGNVFTELGRYDEAFIGFDKAVSIRPDLEGIEGCVFL